MSELSEKLEAIFKAETGKPPKGFFELLLKSFSFFVEQYYSSLEFIKKEAFVVSATENAVFLHGGMEMELRGVGRASGYVVFFGEVDSIIPVGTVVKDDPLKYETTAEGVIYEEAFEAEASVSEGEVVLPPNFSIPSCRATANGESVELFSTFEGIKFMSNKINDGDTVTLKIIKSDKVPVEAREVGKSHNKFFNDFLSTELNLDGIEESVSVISLDGGKDREDVESYKRRYLNYKRRPAPAFTERNIQVILIEKIKSLRGVWVKPNEQGVMTVFALNNNWTLTDEEKAEIQENLALVKPISFHNVDIPVTIPTIEVVDVVIKDLYPTFEALKDAVTANIRSLFNKDLFNKEIVKEEIESVIYRTSFGSSKVESYILQSGWTSVKLNTIWKLGDVTYT